MMATRSSRCSETYMLLVLTSRLDYGNVLLYGLPDNLSERLQKVQNVAASVITRHPNGITSLNTGSVQAPLVTDKRTNFVL